MPQIQAPALAEALRRKFEIVGASSIDTIAPELVGVVIVDELTPRLQRHEAAVSAVATGDAGDLPEIELRNMDPGRLLVVDEIHLAASGNVRLRVRLLAPAGTLSGSQGQGTSRDFRNPIVQPGFTDIATDSPAGGGTILAQANIAVNNVYRVRPNLVLREAGGLDGAVQRDRMHVDTNGAATTLIATFFFHMEERELRRVG